MEGMRRERGKGGGEAADLPNNSSSRRYQEVIEVL
jgi:hypothetical protein